MKKRKNYAWVIKIEQNVQNNQTSDPLTLSFNV